MFNNHHCQSMSDKDHASRARVHSISEGLIVMHLIVCMEFNLFVYILLDMHMSCHWPLLVEALHNLDSHVASLFTWL